MGKGLLILMEVILIVFSVTLLYVAKVEEECTKKAQQMSETDEKENERTSATSQQVEGTEEKPSPTPERRQRKAQTLRLKLPGDQEETRKRHHSSHRRSREEMTEVHKMYMVHT